MALEFGLATFRVLALATLVASAPSATAEPADAPPMRLSALPPAQIDNTLVVGGEDIAAKKIASRMTVAVNVNETGPYRFVVDSGADTSVIGHRIAGNLGLPLSTPVVLHATTESRLVDRVVVQSLRIGSTDVEDLALPVLAEDDIGGDGLLGLDSLVRQRLMLDFEKRTISIDDARKREPLRDAEIVVTARLRKGQLILANVSAGRTSLDAIVDTGSEITIGNSALREQLAKSLADKFETIEVIGVTGEPMHLQLLRVPSLIIGPVHMRDVPIAFADIPPFELFGMEGRPSLLLGTDVMAAFRRVSLDFRARKVRFQLRRCETQGVRLSTTTAYATRLTSASDTPAACSR